MIKTTVSTTPTLSKRASYSRATKLCIPKGLIRKLLVKEVHGGGLAGHFGINKTIDMLNEHFFCPKMGGDIHEVIFKCSICQKANRQFHQGLYTIFAIPNGPWEDVSVDFIVAPKDSKGQGYHYGGGRSLFKDDSLHSF